MHKARAFFYVCAGLFLLALAYHLGARSAAAQSPQVALAAFDAGNNLVALSDRSILRLTPDGSCRNTSPPIPGVSPVVAVGGGGGCSGSFFAGLENGDFYSTGATGWTLIGNVFGAPTPVQRESFGSVKARYR